MPNQRTSVNDKLRVLVVEDEALVADYVADLVEEAGHEVVGIVATGEQALAFLQGGGIDLALLDIKLKGGITGIDVARVACSRSVAHVFITGSGDPLHARGCGSHGSRRFPSEAFQ
jgi:CheY-like chemotaxis protein